MSDDVREGKQARKADQWRQHIADQERSDLSVKQFCTGRGLAECSFYAWRKRLRAAGPVRFALVERRAAQRGDGKDGWLELILVTGERLRISSGVDSAMLRTVLQALRG